INVDMWGNASPLQGYTKADALHWDGTSWQTVNTSDTNTPGYVFTVRRTTTSSILFGGDGAFWAGASGTYSTTPIPLPSSCSTGLGCAFPQISSIKLVPGASTAWAVGSYVDNNSPTVNWQRCAVDGDCDGCAGCNTNADCVDQNLTTCNTSTHV